jgi:hypothetical protein
MAFTIKIKKTKNELAKNLLWYLKSLSQNKEYDFLQILEDEESLTEDVKQELDARYEHFLANHEIYQ